ncbi:hypothetical protein IRJ41_005495 [Triplophysa rosa]|uniref:Uncharacterized protein n=1 Tax=Triplophysa rosa TaxID=992332 RepID=A0A9W7WKX5_TRIRA|nr:hypothetical protein IRJ41_005495 [Triplophysa rosa]
MADGRNHSGGDTQQERQIYFEPIKYGQRIHDLVKHSSTGSTSTANPYQAVREPVDITAYDVQRRPFVTERGLGGKRKDKERWTEDHRQLNQIVLKDGGRACCRLHNARPDPLRDIQDSLHLGTTKKLFLHTLRFGWTQ